jgi:hypothetical protein
MALNKAIEKLKFDSRMIPIYLTQEVLTQKELDEYLKQLPDNQEKVAPAGQSDSADDE